MAFVKLKGFYMLCGKILIQEIGQELYS